MDKTTEDLTLGSCRGLLLGKGEPIKEDSSHMALMTKGGFSLRLSP